MQDTRTASIIAELREFAGFSAAEQRFICRSLDVGLGRQGALSVWPRTAAEKLAIQRQNAVYAELVALRGQGPALSNLENLAEFLGPLIRVVAFDLAQERLSCFSSFRFLYERLLGPEVRPYLPSVFCAAAALPHIRPVWRKHLLGSISEMAVTAPGWTLQTPIFYPEWVEKEPL